MNINHCRRILRVPIGLHAIDIHIRAEKIDFLGNYLRCIQAFTCYGGLCDTFSIFYRPNSGKRYLKIAFVFQPLDFTPLRTLHRQRYDGRLIDKSPHITRCCTLLRRSSIDIEQFFLCGGYHQRSLTVNDINHRSRILRKPVGLHSVDIHIRAENIDFLRNRYRNFRLQCNCQSSNIVPFEADGFRKFFLKYCGITFSINGFNRNPEICILKRQRGQPNNSLLPGNRHRSFQFYL